MSRNAEAQGSGAGGAEQVQDPVYDQDAEDEGLIDAFEQELDFSEQEEAEFSRPQRGKQRASDDDDDGEDDDPEGGDEDDQDEDDDEDEPAEAKAADDRKRDKSANEAEEPEGDYVEHEGKKIAVAELLQSHKFRTEVGDQITQIRERVYERATQEMETQKAAIDTAVKSANEMMALVKQLVPELQAPSLSMLDARSDDYDPEAYHQILALHEQYKTLRAAAEGKLKEANEAAEKEQRTRHSRLLEEQARKLVAKYPEFADPAKGKAKSAEVREFLTKSYGFSEAEVNGILDARLFDVIFDAKAHRDAVAKGKPKLEKEKATPRLVRRQAREAPTRTGKKGGQGNRQGRRGVIDEVRRTGKVRSDQLEGYWGDLID